MRGDPRDDKGAVATEAALLYAGLALFFVPVLALMGWSVKGLFTGTEDKVSSVVSKPVQNGGAGDPTAAAKARLEGQLANQVATAMPGKGRPAVSCDSLPAPNPPSGSTTDCSAEFSDGSTTRVVVLWTDDSGGYSTAIG